VTQFTEHIGFTEYLRASPLGDFKVGRLIEALSPTVFAMMR